MNLPRHVKPLVAPHEPSRVAPVGVATAPLDVALPEPAAKVVDAHAAAVKTDEVATLAAAVRYQLASGSPKHSPNVTILYPFAIIKSSM
jgi:hypothetical protein